MPYFSGEAVSYNPLALILDIVEGPPTAMLLLVNDEYNDIVQKMKQQFSAYLYGPPGRPLVMPWRCPSTTLYRRALRGGRKGRSAVRRLKQRGDWPKVAPSIMWYRG